MTEPVRRIIISIIRVALIIFGVYLLLRLSRYCIPFIIAFILSSLIEPLVSFLERKAKIPRKIGSVFSILLVLSVLGTILTLAITRLVKETINVYNQINVIFGSMQQFFEAVVEKVNSFYISLPKTISDTIDQYFAEAASNAKELLAPVVNGITNFTMSLPQALVFLIVTILATYFMTSDKNKINSFLENQLPNQWLDKTQTVMSKLFSALLGWLRAQLILMFITFTELSVAFLVMRVENGLLFAVLIAFVDALPVFGVGTFLIPWGAMELLSGNYQRGVSLLLLYIIILVIRQLIEPKIVGKQIGIHPLLTLFSMYLGLQIFGIVGMIIGPVLVVIIKSVMSAIIKTEKFPVWIKRVLGFSPRPFRTKKENTVDEEVIK